jgi:hypothetical protein
MVSPRTNASTRFLLRRFPARVSERGGIGIPAKFRMTEPHPVLYSETQRKPRKLLDETHFGDSPTNTPETPEKLLRRRQ